MSIFPDELEENRILREMDQRPSTIEKIRVAITELADEDKFGVGGFWYNGYGRAILLRILKELNL